jgi:hypothetical protein
MIEVELRVVDDAEVADRLARRLRADLADIHGVADAALVRRPASASERGIVDEIGKLAVKLATGGGAEALIGAVRSVLSRGGDREVVMKLPDGTEFVLKGGGLSQAQFGKATDALLALVARGSGRETA